MPDEAGRGDKSESEIEAEMLRMMEQEAAGEASADAAPASESGDSAEDEMMQMMQQAMTESQEEAGASASAPTDQVLEMEMLKAMQGDDASGVAAPFQAFPAPADTESVSTGLSRILDVDVKMTVELGSNHVPIKDILLWGEGTVVELERMEREPVDVLVNGKLFARGEVVVVGETFGVKITELLNGITRR